jgi:hypothetical protein
MKMLPLIGLTALLGAAPAAQADVLVSAVPDHLACGKEIKVGVWYQSYSGGPRKARITIRSRGHRVVHKRVRATTTWKYWRYDANCGQRYTVVYRVPGGTVRFPVAVGS